MPVATVAQHRRRVNGCDHAWLWVELQVSLGWQRNNLTTLSGDSKRRAQKRLRRGRAEAQDYLGSHRLDFGDKPRSARDDLGTTGFLVYPPSAAPPSELEMLHGVGLVRQPWIDVGLVECSSEQSSRRTDERQTRAVLLVPRLFAHQHDRGPGLSMTEDRLGGVLKKRAAPATVGRRSQRFEPTILG